MNRIKPSILADIIAAANKIDKNYFNEIERGYGEKLLMEAIAKIK